MCDWVCFAWSRLGSARTCDEVAFLSVFWIALMATDFARKITSCLLPFSMWACPLGWLASAGWAQLISGVFLSVRCIRKHKERKKITNWQKGTCQMCRKKSIVLELGAYCLPCRPVPGFSTEGVAEKSKHFSVLVYSFFYISSHCFSSHLLGTYKLSVLTGASAFRKWIWKPYAQTCKEVDLLQMFSGISARSPSPARKEEKPVHVHFAVRSVLSMQCYQECWLGLSHSVFIKLL